VARRKRRVSRKELRVILITFLTSLGIFALLTIFTESVQLTLLGWAVVALICLGSVAYFTKMRRR